MRPLATSSVARTCRTRRRPPGTVQLQRIRCQQQQAAEKQASRCGNDSPGGGAAACGGRAGLVGQVDENASVESHVATRDHRIVESRQSV